MGTGVETVKQSLNGIETNKGLFHNLNAHCKQISFGIKNESEVQGILTVLKCICGPDLEILTWIAGE